MEESLKRNLSSRRFLEEILMLADTLLIGTTISVIREWSITRRTDVLERSVLFSGVAQRDTHTGRCSSKRGGRCP